MVEEGLEEVRSLLEREGFEVVSPNEAAGAVAWVSTGMDQDITGMADMEVLAPFIDARGKSAEEIVEAVKARARRLEA